MANCIYGSDKCPLNPDPTDVQRAQWRRHHKKGTSPGNPKWYRAAAMPAAPKSWAGQKPKYPVIERPAPSLPIPKGKDALTLAKRAGDDVLAYVAAFDAAMGYKPEYKYLGKGENHAR